MKSAIPKQFLPLGSKPILVHTISKFLEIIDLQIILALPSDAIEYWNTISGQYFLDTSRIKAVEGGKTRFQSVKNALSSIVGESGLVAVHDGVRPFVSLEIIESSFVLAQDKQTAVVCVDSKDSVRLMEGETNKSVERKTVKLVQTPQTFELNLLRKAYEVDDSEMFTDDASVVEKHGHPIFLLEGDYRNIKITSPEDLEIGELFLKNISK
jgi:2-C-methyl-D-erythritol 4-phosphate cytidylyltransferase